MSANNNPNLIHSQTQREAILEHLLTGSELNAMDALTHYGTMKLATRISELRQMSFPISAEWFTLQNGKRVKSYRIV